MTTSQPKRQPIPFGKYLLLDRINIGGMAEVWRGKQFGASGFERLVAIKRILPNIAEDEEFISMFIDEAKISVQLTHANIAQIYELGQITSSYFISMEYIAGKDMRAIFDRCRKKGEPAPVPLVAFCVAKMCEGLDYAHRKKDGMGRDMHIVHRDISPQNILISYEGEVKVIDFGIAKAAGKATKTQAGILKGKFGYMSPEQIRGLPLDRRSDVFAIGVCLYEMLTGERLFVGESDFSVLEKVRKAEVPSPSTYNRRIPENLEKIVLKALAKDVDERYQYASELGDDLQRFLITSDSIFSRKDLMQYMKSTFAEEVEREKQRLIDYADIRPPDGLLAALEAASGMGGGHHAPAPAPAPVAPAMEPVAPPPRATASMPPVSPGGVRRAPTLTALPKLTAATAAPSPREDEVLATQLVSSGHFEDSPEPTTQPGANVGRAVTPLESRTPPKFGNDDEEEAVSGKTAIVASPATTPPPPPVMAPPPTLAPSAPRLSQASMPAVPGPPVLGPSPRGSAPVLAPMDGPPPGPGSSQRPSRGGGDGLPRLTRELPPDFSQGIPRNALPPEPPSNVGQRSQPPGPPVMAPLPVAARSRPPAPVVQEPDFGDEDKPTTQVPALARIKGLDKRVLFGVLGGSVLLLMILVGWMLMPSNGYIVLELQGVPPDARARLQATLDAQPVPIEKESPSVLRQVKSGDVVVMVSAEGFKTFTRTVKVVAGKTVTTVDVALERLARNASLVLVTEPQDAQVKVDGKVVRAQGKRDAFIQEVPVTGPEWTVEVSAPEHKPATRKVTVTNGAPAEVNVKLAREIVDVAVRVESKPPGATIFADGKDLGVTPALVRVAPSVRQLTLRLRCYDDGEVVVPTSQPGVGEAELGVVPLKRQRGCR